MVTSGLGDSGQKIEFEVLHEIRLLSRSHEREVSALVDTVSETPVDILKPANPFPLCTSNSVSGMLKGIESL